MKDQNTEVFPALHHLSPRKMAFITGTLLLTATGFFCRILGFFYRIFLSRTIGAEGLGVYQMIHPVFGICFAVCAGSIQTALSQYVAANQEKGKSVFRTGLMIAMALSGLLAWGIYVNSDFLAKYFLMEPRCSPYLPVIALSVPFAALHACINGYYYGMQKARVPAFSQVAEQLIRMGAVFLIARIWLETGKEITVQLAVYGHLIGEMASAGFTLFCMGFFPPDSSEKTSAKLTFPETAGPLMALAIPLMGNRLVLNILGSAEAIWIPNRLKASGLSDSASFSIYGVLTGMSLPFILLPSTIFNSLAVLLLPTVAKAQSDGNKQQIAGTIAMCLRYCLYVGILCIGIFILFGNELGFGVFKNKDSGTFITILAWLCPFLYLVTTMGSILNGLGKTSITFLHNVAAMVLRLVFVFLGIPRWGIMAYLVGMLASELLLAALHIMTLRRLVEFSWNAWDMIVKPAFVMVMAIGMYYAVLSVRDPFDQLPLFVGTGIHIGILGGLYGGFWGFIMW